MGMYTYNEVRLAIKLMTDVRNYEDASDELKELATILEEAMDMGEFDRTLDDAIRYLVDEDYEIENEAEDFKE